MKAIGIGRSAVLVAALAAAGSTGCSSLGMKNLGGIFGDDDKPAAAEPTATYQVLFVPTNGKAEKVQRTLSGQMHVQDALEQTGAYKKFRRIEVELARPLPSGGIHRIPCEYDRATKRINPEFDYALLPGDRLIVKEDPKNIVDDMLGSALGPLGVKVSNQLHGRSEPKNEHYKVVR